MNTQSPILVIIGLVLNAPVDQSLDNGHLSLLELLLGVTASSVGEIYSMADLDIVGQGDILALDAAPISFVNLYLYQDSLLGLPSPKQLDSTLSTNLANFSRKSLDGGHLYCGFSKVGVGVFKPSELCAIRNAFGDIP